MSDAGSSGVSKAALVHAISSALVAEIQAEKRLVAEEIADAERRLEALDSAPPNHAGHADHGRGTR